MKFIVLTTLLSTILGAALEPVPGTDQARLQAIFPGNIIADSYVQVGEMEKVVVRLFFLAEEQRLGALADVDNRLGNMENNIVAAVKPIVKDYTKKLGKELKRDPLLVFQIELLRDDHVLPADTPAAGFSKASMDKYTQLRGVLAAQLGALQLTQAQLDEAMEYANLFQTKVLNEAAYEERHRITSNLGAPGVPAYLMPRTSSEAFLHLVQTQANKYKDEKVPKPADCVQRLGNFANNPNNFPSQADIHKYHQLQVLGNVAKLLLGNIKQTDGQQELAGYKGLLDQAMSDREANMKAWPGFQGHATTRKCILENEFQGAVDSLLDDFFNDLIIPPRSFQIGMTDSDSMLKHSLTVLHSIARFFSEAIDITRYTDGSLLPDTIRRAQALGEHWAAVLEGGNLPATPIFFNMLTSCLLDGPDAQEAAQSLMDNYVSLGGKLLSTPELDKRYGELEHSVNLLSEADQAKFGKLVFAEVLKRHDPKASFGRAIIDFFGIQGQQQQNDEILIRPYLALLYSGLIYKVEKDHVSTQKQDIDNQGIDCSVFNAPRSKFKSHVSKMVLYSILRDGSRFLERLGVVARKEYFGLATQNFGDFDIVTDGTAVIIQKAELSKKYVTEKFIGFGPGNDVCKYYAAVSELATTLKADAQFLLSTLQAVDDPDVRIPAIGEPDFGNHPDPYSNVSTEKINISGEGNSTKDSGDEAVQVQEIDQTVNASESAPTATTSSKSAAPMSIETSQALGLLTAVAAGFVVLFA